MDWLTRYKIPIGTWIKQLVDLLTTHAQGFFDLVSTVLGSAVGALSDLLLALPALVVVAKAPAAKTAD